MLFSPLFRVGDVVTVRSDLQPSGVVHMLFAYDDTEYTDTESAHVLYSDIHNAGHKFVIVRAAGHDHGFAEHGDLSSETQTIPDELTVEARRVMRYMDYSAL